MALRCRHPGNMTWTPMHRLASLQTQLAGPPPAARRHRAPAHAAAAAAADGLPELIPHDMPRQHTDSVGSFPRSPSWTADGHRTPGSRGAGPPLQQDASGAVLPSVLAQLTAQVSSQRPSSAAEPGRARASLTIRSAALPRRRNRRRPRRMTSEPPPRSSRCLTCSAHGRLRSRSHWPR